MSSTEPNTFTSSPHTEQNSMPLCASSAQSSLVSSSSTTMHSATPASNNKTFLSSRKQSFCRGQIVAWPSAPRYVLRRRPRPFPPIACVAPLPRSWASQRAMSDVSGPEAYHGHALLFLVDYGWPDTISMPIPALPWNSQHPLTRAALGLTPHPASSLFL